MQYSREIEENKENSLVPVKIWDYHFAPEFTEISVKLSDW